jgi:2-methylcitrate dehydratase PrpD
MMSARRETVLASLAAQALAADPLSLPGTVEKAKTCLIDFLSCAFESRVNGGSEMYFHPGFASRNAISCIELAEAGAVASSDIIEGDAGQLAALCAIPANHQPTEGHA